MCVKDTNCRCIKAIVSDSAFSVPPQQLITNDGGIIEIGAEVQYGITDVVVMVREVADHQDILRSLGKTVLVRLLAKKHVGCLPLVRLELKLSYR